MVLVLDMIGILLYFFLKDVCIKLVCVCVCVDVFLCCYFVCDV